MVHNLIANVKEDGAFYLKVVPHDLEKSNRNKQETGQLIAKENKNFITVDTNTLKEILCCGRKTAVEIGMAANAKITIGKRVLWNVALIQKYLDSIAF